MCRALEPKNHFAMCLIINELVSNKSIIKPKFISMKKTTLNCSLVLLFVLTANGIFAQFVPKAVQTNNTVIQGLCDRVEPAGWLYFKEETEIDPYTYFDDYAQAMGLGSDDEMVVVKEWQSNGYNHIKFEQRYKSIPVKSGVYTLHTKDCHTELAHGKIVEQLNISLPATVSESSALQTALNAIGATTYAWQDTDWENDLKTEEENPNATYYPVGKLEIYGESGLPMTGANFNLVYRFDILALDPYSFQEVIVNAHTGQIIKKSDKGLHADGTCATLYNGTRTIQTDHRWLQNDFILRDKSRGKSIWTKFYDEDEPAWSFMNNIADNDNSWPASVNDATSAHWAAEMAWDYFHNTWDREGPDGGGNKLRIIANWHMHGQAKWEQYGGQDAIWVGNDSILQAGIGALDVVGHEFTHGVSRSAAGLIGGGTNEEGALVESFSDIFGEVIEHSVLGSHDWVQGGETGGSIPKRNLANPNATSNPDTYKTGTFWDNAEDPHINCGVQNRWFSLLAEGGSQNGFNVFNGIGFDKATKIAYVSLNDFLQGGATYNDAREASINAAKFIFGPCSMEERLTTIAWAAVGVGPTYSGNCIQITGPGSVCTGVGSPVSWTANVVNPNSTITWSYPSYWNCTTSGQGNKILTLHSMSPQPPFSMTVTISASYSGGSDSHNIYMVAGCLDDPNPCPDLEERSKEVKTRKKTNVSKTNIFPNPTSGKLVVTTGKINGTCRIEVVNTLGMVVISQYVDGSNFEIDTYTLTPGSYVLKIIQPQTQEVHTFVKI